jgi:hypothetical protein
MDQNKESRGFGAVDKEVRRRRQKERKKLQRSGTMMEQLPLEIGSQGWLDKYHSS